MISLTVQAVAGANVAGQAGVEFIAKTSANLPLDVTVMTPSCVPATPMATAGGCISSAHIQSLRNANIGHGLAEVMNFPGVLAGSDDVLAKLRGFAGRPLDGHVPGLTGPDLQAYAVAGISSDHESITAQEARVAAAVAAVAAPSCW